MKTKALIGLSLALAIMTWLYLGKRDDLASAIEGFNTTQALEIAEERRLTTEALNAAHSRELAERDQLYQNLEKALTEQAEAAELARMGSADRDKQIERLQLEAFNDEIPDSSECLNVNAPSGVFYTGDCREAGDSGGSGSGPVCGNPEIPNSGDPAFNRFTLGEVLQICNANAVNQNILNGQLRSIRGLNNE